MVKPLASVPPTAYVPILKGKMAEYGALESCTSAFLVPLVEVTSPETAHAAIARAWPRPTDVIWIHALNFGGLDEVDFAANIATLFDDLRPDVAAVPVVTITEGPDTLTAIRRIADRDRRGVVLRIDAEDILDAASDTTADIATTLSELALDPSQTDLVVDGGLLKGTATVRAAVAGQCLRAIPDLAEWRTVAVAFSAFPIPLSSVVSPESVRAVSRTDAAAFVLTARTSSRPIVFSDYTLGSPSYDSVPFTPIPNIRYASGSEWYIHRATERRNPAAQFRALSADVVAAPYYSGPSFSPGDQQIHDAATGAGGPGNPTTHLRAGISRHVHVVLERLSTLGEP